MALVMAALVIAIGIAQARIVNAMKTNTQAVKRIGGAILVGVGSWLIILALWASFLTRILTF